MHVRNAVKERKDVHNEVWNGHAFVDDMSQLCMFRVELPSDIVQLALHMYSGMRKRLGWGRVHCRIVGRLELFCRMPTLFDSLHRPTPA